MALFMAKIFVIIFGKESETPVWISMRKCTRFLSQNIDFCRIAFWFVHGEKFCNYFLRGIRQPSWDIYAKIYRLFASKHCFFQNR